MTSLQYPLQKDEAGRAAWTLMHHRASLYSENPTDKEKKRMKDFLLESMSSVAKLCKDCKSHIYDYLKKHPLEPALKNKKALSKYLCEFHNHVRNQQGKDIVNCHLVAASKPAEECKDCKITVNDTSNSNDLKASFEKFKEASTRVFHKLCDKYKVPYPTIKFHECPNNPLNSCTSMWVDSQTQDIIERPVVYLHPNMFGLRSIVHEFLHYIKQLSKDTLGGLDEMEVEREAQAIINHEFPYDEMDPSDDKRFPVVQQQQIIVRKDVTSRLRNFPLASKIYDRHLVNIRRRDSAFYRPESENGDWIFDMMGGVTSGHDEGSESSLLAEPESSQRRFQNEYHALSFLDGLYAPFGALFGVKASELNRNNTPVAISNAALTIAKSQLSPIGALLFQAVTGLSIYGALALGKNGMGYADRLLMNSFGAQFLWNSLDYLRPDVKQDVIDGAMALGTVISTQQFNLIPKILLGDYLLSLMGESTPAVASPLTEARNLQRASLSKTGGSGRIGSGSGSNTISRADIDPRQRLQDLKEHQEIIQSIKGKTQESSRPFKTSSKVIGSSKTSSRGPISSKIVPAGTDIQIDEDTVMIPSDDEEETYESSFGMHVADGRNRRSFDNVSSTGEDFTTTRRRNTIKDIFETDANYDNFNDVYYEEYGEEPY